MKPVRYQLSYRMPIAISSCRPVCPQMRKRLKCPSYICKTSTKHCFHSTLAFGPYLPRNLPLYLPTVPSYCTSLPTIPPYCTYLIKLTWHEHGIPNHSWPMPGQLPPKAAPKGYPRKLPPKAALKAAPKGCP